MLVTMMGTRDKVSDTGYEQGKLKMDDWLRWKKSNNDEPTQGETDSSAES